MRYLTSVGLPRSRWCHGPSAKRSVGDGTPPHLLEAVQDGLEVGPGPPQQQLAAHQRHVVGGVGLVHAAAREAGGLRNHRSSVTETEKKKHLPSPRIRGSLPSTKPGRSALESGISRPEEGHLP